MPRMVKKQVKQGVTNEKIMKVLLNVSEKLGFLEQQSEITGRRVLRFDDNISSMGSRIKRFETEVGKHMKGSEERLNEIEGAIKSILEWGAMKADLNDLATKGDLERVKNEIIEPMSNAVDKDAETIYDFGKRIIVLEHKVGISTK